MPESGLPTLGAPQRERLRALGYELLALRGEPAAAAHAEAVPPGGAARLRLRMSAAAQSHPLLAPLLRALGVERDACVAADAAGAQALPLLALGAAGTDATLAVESLDALRDADAKRRLWPTLRRLRRSLRDR